MIQIRVNGTPAPQGSKRHVGNGRMIEMSKAVGPWREAVRAETQRIYLGRPDWDTAAAGTCGRPVDVSVTFVLARPKGHFRTGRNAHLLRDTAPTFPAGKPDIDKLARAVLDGLTAGGAFADDGQVAILSAQAQRHPIDTLAPCVSIDDVLMVRRRAASVRMSDELKRYAVDVVRATRAANGIQLGASPRASLALMKAAQALALSEGREFVIPEDVREMAVPVIAHRVVVEPQARFAGVTTAGLVEEILAKVPMPS